MKRCPHCEFIYEDDQSYCDMDGTKLAHDPRTLPKMQALSATQESDSKWRSRAVPVFASAFLAIVLGVVYFVSIQQVEPNVRSASTTVEMPANDPAPAPTAPSSSEATPPQSEVDTASGERETANAGGSEANKPAERPSNKQSVGRSTSAAQSRNQRNVGAKDQSEKDDSKVKPIIKKTGRFFKKILPL